MTAKAETLRAYLGAPQYGHKSDGVFVFTKEPGKPLEIFLSRFSHPDGTPFTHEEMGVSQRATDLYLFGLSGKINPDTKKPYTDNELATIFGLPEPIIKLRIARGANPDAFKPPEIIEKPLADNERAFFAGVAFGNYTKRQISWEEKDFIVIGTEGKNPRHRKLLTTFGGWGDMRENKSELKVYLHPDTFAFVLKPDENRAWLTKILETKRLFAPFLLGFLLSRLSETEKRISTHDENLLARISRAANNHQIPLGNVTTQQRSNGAIYILKVTRLEETLSALFQNIGVRSLSFFADLIRSFSEKSLTNSSSKSVPIHP